MLNSPAKTGVSLLHLWTWFDGCAVHCALCSVVEFGIHSNIQNWPFSLIIHDFLFKLAISNKKLLFDFLYVKICKEIDAQTLCGKSNKLW